MTLTASLTLSAGCASTGKDVPVQEFVDYVGLEKGQEFKAPVRGQFLSDKYYQFLFDQREAK